MSSTDIYGYGECKIGKSLRYVHIICNNVVGMLNRITSLTRRKRFSIDEISVFFSNDELAHICIMIDGEKFDVQQMMHQFAKIHDVLDVSDITDQTDKLYNNVYVMVQDKKEFGKFPFQPEKIVQENGGYKGIFIISINEVPRLREFLDKNHYQYAHRLVHLV